MVERLQVAAEEAEVAGLEIELPDDRSRRLFQHDGGIDLGVEGIADDVENVATLPALDHSCLPTGKGTAGCADGASTVSLTIDFDGGRTARDQREYRRWKEPAESHLRRNRIRWRLFLRG